MPTYEYRCKACGQELEVVQSFTDDPLTTCEACGGPLRKVFGNVGIAFKGSGFYKNDSRGKATSSAPGTEKAGDSNGGSGAKGGDSGSTKADTSSATKADGAGASSTPKPAKADKATTAT